MNEEQSRFLQKPESVVQRICPKFGSPVRHSGKRLLFIPELISWYKLMTDPWHYSSFFRGQVSTDRLFVFNKCGHNQYFL